MDTIYMTFLTLVLSTICIVPGSSEIVRWFDDAAFATLLYVCSQLVDWRVVPLTVELPTVISGHFLACTAANI
jgi:hypothetical protein